MLALDTFCFMTRFVSWGARGASPPEDSGSDLDPPGALPGRGSDPHGVGDAGNGRGTRALSQPESQEKRGAILACSTDRAKRLSGHRLYKAPGSRP